MENNDLRIPTGAPSMWPLDRLAPSLAQYNALDCGLVRVGRGNWLVFVGGMCQNERPFTDRLSAVTYLAKLVAMNTPGDRAAEALAAALRG